MVVIIGASASGKTEISKILQNEYGFKKCITTTTRKMRLNEINHVDYHFISKNEFLFRLGEGEFVEHAIYNDNYYGINSKDISSDALVIVEPNGANTLIDKLCSDAYVVYIETNEDIRKNRMIKRNDDIKDIINRLNNDEEVFRVENVKRIDLMVQNNEHDIYKVAKYIAKCYKESKVI